MNDVHFSSRREYFVGVHSLSVEEAQHRNIAASIFIRWKFLASPNSAGLYEQMLAMNFCAFSRRLSIPRCSCRAIYNIISSKYDICKNIYIFSNIFSELHESWHIDISNSLIYPRLMFFAYIESNLLLIFSFNLIPSKKMLS